MFFGSAVVAPKVLGRTAVGKRLGKHVAPPVLHPNAALTGSVSPKIGLRRDKLGSGGDTDFVLTPLAAAR